MRITVLTCPLILGPSPGWLAPITGRESPVLHFFQPLKPLLKIFLILRLISDSASSCTSPILIPALHSSCLQFSVIFYLPRFISLVFSLLGADLQAVEGSQAFLEFGTGFPGLAISQLAPPILGHRAPLSLGFYRWICSSCLTLPCSPCCLPLELPLSAPRSLHRIHSGNLGSFRSNHPNTDSFLLPLHVFEDDSGCIFLGGR